MQRGYSAHPQILDYEGRKHTAPHTFTAEAAYAVHFFQHIHRFWKGLQRGYSAHPQIVDFEGRKHTAPHTFAAEAAYAVHFLLSTSTAKAGNTQPPTHLLLKQPTAVHFLQRGYSAHPQILDYEGRKHTAPHTFTADSYAVHFFLRCISCSEATQHIHRFWILKAGNTQPPTHLLLKQPTLYISCSEATQHIHRFWISKAGNTQPPTHLLLKQPTLYISSSEATQHIHRFWISKAGNTQPPTHLLLKQPTLYISSSEATQHTTDSGLQRQETHSPPHIYC